MPPPVLVEVRRGPVVESRHRGHVVQVGASGLIEQVVGDPGVVVSLRSAVKPFALAALVESGAADALHLTAPELAVMASSHHGEDLHVRTLQAVFRRAGMSQSLLACGSAGAPLDALTAARLARDGEKPGAIRHMCSGFHAASLLLAHHAGWPVEDYWHPDHPSQVAVRAVLGRVFGVRPAALVTAGDDCGVLTYAFPLVDVAHAFALLADPVGAARDATRASLAPALTRIRDAMVEAPELVGGSRGSLSTSLMRARPGTLVAKSGAEALQGVGILPGARGKGSSAAGMAVSIEDGDERGRALGPVTIDALGQVGVFDEKFMRQLGKVHLPPSTDAHGEVVVETVVSYQLAPIAELL
ncbi:MAG: asparaginase [Candidatus Limnocylindrales bacterium]